MCTFIIPEKTLESLICASCGCYLSVLPIRNIDNETRCGRCCNKSLGVPSPLEKQYKNGLFRCSNRYQGCNKLMKFEQTLEHEKQCKRSVDLIRCTKCPMFYTTATGIIHHFKTYHSLNILLKPKFTLNVIHGLMDVYLYYFDNFIFLINVEYDKATKELSSSISCVNHSKLTNISHQLFIKYINKTKTCIRTKSMPCNKINEHMHRCSMAINKVQGGSNNPSHLTCKALIDIVETPEPLELLEKTEPKKKANQQTVNNNLKLIKNNLTDDKGKNNNASTSTATKSAKVTMINKEVQTVKNTNTIMLKSKKVQTEIDDEKIVEIGTRLNKNIQTIPLQFILGVHLTEKFLEKYSEYSLTACGTALSKEGDGRVDLCCSNCKQFTGANVFSCKNSHIRCRDCKVWCDICNDVVEERNAELSSLNELLMLPCRWKCKELFSGTELKWHEKNCTHRPKLKCPVCSWLVGYSELEVHFQRHDNCSVYLEFPPLHQLSSNVNVYFLLGDNFFVITVDTAPDAVKLKSCEKLENCTSLMIINDEEVHVLQNKTYRLFVVNKCKMLLKSKNISKVC